MVGHTSCTEDRVVISAIVYILFFLRFYQTNGIQINGDDQTGHNDQWLSLETTDVPLQFLRIEELVG
jgi:hypothetical protein